jgi:hypothetical protein
LSQYHFVHQKPYMNWPGPEPKYRVADYWRMWNMYLPQGFKRLRNYVSIRLEWLRKPTITLRIVSLRAEV